MKPVVFSKKKHTQTECWWEWGCSEISYFQNEFIKENTS